MPVDPTVAAVLPLGGVALGVLLGGVARHVLDRRSEERSEAAALRAAARIVSDDLWRMRQVLEKHQISALDDEVRRARLTSSAWEQTRLTLARDHEAWNATRNAVLQVKLMLDTYRAAKEQPQGLAMMHYHVRAEQARERIGEAAVAPAPLGAGVVPQPWRKRLKPRRPRGRVR